MSEATSGSPYPRPKRDSDPGYRGRAAAHPGYACALRHRPTTPRKTNRGGGHDSSAPALTQAKRGTHGSDMGGDCVLKLKGHGPDVAIRAVNVAYAATAFLAVGTDAIVFKICEAMA